MKVTYLKTKCKEECMNVTYKVYEVGSKKMNIYILLYFINFIFGYSLETTSVYRERNLQRNAGLDVQTEI